MNQIDVKACYDTAVRIVSSNILSYTEYSGDFTRKRKLPPEKMISFLVSQGASATKNELIDFYGLDCQAPSASALNQQRAKLSCDALACVFYHFNDFASRYEQPGPYLFVAADGTTFTFYSRPCFSSDDYFVHEGHSAKGFYSMHLNAFYDLNRHIYLDALIQPVHSKDEFRAFCTMADRHETPQGSSTVFLGDRGYCSYNNMAHVIENGQFFLFRTKDIHSKGLAHGFGLPDDGPSDSVVKVALVRSNSKKIRVPDGCHRRYIDKAASFDFMEYGSDAVYELTFRVVRFQLPDSSYECIVTNLPADEFPPERIKELYFRRWGVECSFRSLKYTIGLVNFHSYKAEYIMQEIWAKLLHFNVTQTLILHTAVPRGDTKWCYAINFSVAAHICRIWIRMKGAASGTDVAELLRKELVPLREDRQYPRLKTAHFRKPRYALYRAA